MLITRQESWWNDNENGINKIRIIIDSRYRVTTKTVLECKLHGRVWNIYKNEFMHLWSTNKHTNPGGVDIIRRIALSGR